MVDGILVIKVLALEIFSLWVWIKLLTWDSGMYMKPKPKPQPKERIIFKRHDNYPYD